MIRWFKDYSSVLVSHLSHKSVGSRTQIFLLKEAAEKNPFVVN
jgi:hypothetical protein